MIVVTFVTFSLPNIGWFKLLCTGFEEADFEKKRLGPKVGGSTFNIHIDNLFHGNSDQSTRDVNASRVSRIAASFIATPYAGKVCPLVCVLPEDAETFDLENVDSSRFVIVGNNHLIAGMKEAREHHGRGSEAGKYLSIVECKLYKGLTDSQMKAFGAQHNVKQGLHEKMTPKELLLSFNRSSTSNGLREIRLSTEDNPRSNPHQQELKKTCYKEAGLEADKTNSNLYVWDLATKFKQATFELLIKVMEMYEKSECLGQNLKQLAAPKAVVKPSTGKKPRAKPKAAFQPNLPVPRITSNSTLPVEVHATPPAMPSLSKLHLQFLHECCKHSEDAVVKTLSKV